MYKLLVFALSLFASLVFSVSSVHAGEQHNVTGYAWSSNVGWISFNCTNEGTCGAVDYGVLLEPDGDLVGYAWSASVGWIQFGGLTGFPTGSGTTAVNARILSGTGQGWARALSNGNGWDGWISLSGSYGAGTYGLTQSATNFTGYGWGGDVVGWVLFDVDSIYPGVCTDCGVDLSGDASLDVKSAGISLNGNNDVPYGTNPTYEWTLTGLSGGTTCTVSKNSSGGTAFSTISGITASGTYAGPGLSDATYTFGITCDNGGNTVVSKPSAVTFTVDPEPAAFSLGNPETAEIQFTGNGTADSEAVNIFVNPNNSFMTAGNPVNISITGFPSIPATTTYSFDGGNTFLANPGSIQIPYPYSTGVPFKVRIALPITSEYQVTLTGTASGASPATKVITIDPTQFAPIYEEY